MPTETSQRVLEFLARFPLTKFSAPKMGMSLGESHTIVPKLGPEIGLEFCAGEKQSIEPSSNPCLKELIDVL